MLPQGFTKLLFTDGLRNFDFIIIKMEQNISV